VLPYKQQRPKVCWIIARLLFSTNPKKHIKGLSNFWENLNNGTTPMSTLFQPQLFQVSCTKLQKLESGEPLATLGRFQHTFSRQPQKPVYFVAGTTANQTHPLKQNQSLSIIWDTRSFGNFSPWAITPILSTFPVSISNY
jgi:hypothetical protein